MGETIMGVTITDIQNNNGAWSFSWEGVSSVDVYLRGEKIQESISASPVIITDGREPGCPDVELLEAGSYPPLGNAKIRLQWRFIQGAESYNIYTSIGEYPWVALVAVVQNPPYGYVNWETEICPDGTEKSFTVYSVTSGKESLVRAIVSKVIRNPRVPLLSALYSDMHPPVYGTVTFIQDKLKEIGI